MKLKAIVKTLQTIAPVEFAEDWDNVGLLAGNPEQNIRTAMLTVDLTADVFAEAQANNTNLIIAYHPPIWEPVKKVVAGAGPSPLLYEAIRRGIAIYSLHTALDVAPGGINDLLAEIVGIADPQPLQSCNNAASPPMCKLVVFVPNNDLSKVSEAVFAAGAGNIGPDARYSRCSFRTAGTGTFQCGPESRPTIGTRGSFEQVEEYRLETIVPQARLDSVINAMLEAHSYEEVAYDIIPLMSPPQQLGLGRFGRLAVPTNSTTLISKTKKALKVTTAGLIGPKRRNVERAAVAAGSCGTILRQVIAHNCDFYLTGELKHHHALELQQAGVTTLCVSHSNSERVILPRLAQQLRQAHKSLQVTVSKKDRDPFTWS